MPGEIRLLVIRLVVGRSFRKIPYTRPITKCPRQERIRLEWCLRQVDDRSLKIVTQIPEERGTLNPPRIRLRVDPIRQMLTKPIRYRPESVAVRHKLRLLPQLLDLVLKVVDMPHPGEIVAVVEEVVGVGTNEVLTIAGYITLLRPRRQLPACRRGLILELFECLTLGRRESVAELVSNQPRDAWIHAGKLCRIRRHHPLMVVIEPLKVGLLVLSCERGTLQLRLTLCKQHDAPRALLTNGERQIPPPAMRHVRRAANLLAELVNFPQLHRLHRQRPPTPLNLLAQ